MHGWEQHLSWSPPAYYPFTITPNIVTTTAGVGGSGSVTFDYNLTGNALSAGSEGGNSGGDA